MYSTTGFEYIQSRHKLTFPVWFSSLKIHYSTFSTRNISWDALPLCLSSLHCHLFSQQISMHDEHRVDNLGLVSEEFEPWDLFFFSDNTSRSDAGMQKLRYPLILTQEFHPQPREGKSELLTSHFLCSPVGKRMRERKASSSNTVRQWHPIPWAHYSSLY